MTDDDVQGDIKPSLTRRKKNNMGQLGQLEPIVRVARARRRVSGNGVQLSPTVPERTWEISAMDRVAGVGRSIGQVLAPTLRVAETRARELFGPEILVSPAGGKPRRSRQRP